MIELIPAIDIIDGKCVRLSQGDYSSKQIYHTHPVEVAKEFESYGIKRLHIVDLDGAASHHVVNYRILEQIASRTSLVIDFGGGIKSDEDLIIAFDNGAQMVTLGSVAVKQPELFSRWLTQYGNEKIAIAGWKEESSQELMPFLENYRSKGISKVLGTDISRDGMLEGPSTALYQQIMSAYPDLYLIASGGVSSIDDILKLHEIGVPAVVIGKALYEGRISIKELSRYL